MRYPRHIIYKERLSLQDYDEKEKAMVTAISNIVAAKIRGNNVWTIEAIINEAFYETTSLLLDFSEKIFFEADYYNEAVKRMPLSVANTVFSIVYILLREIDELGNVQMMIESKLHSRPIFKALKSFPRNNATIFFYPKSEYFSSSDFVDWYKYTNGFRPSCIERIMRLTPETVSQSIKYQQGGSSTFVARAIYGQAEAAKLTEKISQEQFDKVHDLLYKVIENQLLMWIETSEVHNTGKGTPYMDETINGIIIDLDSFNNLHSYLEARNDAETAKQEQKQLREQLIKAQNEQKKHLEETEEYKQTISEMKTSLGKSYIRLDTIADCILRLPTVELQYTAFQQVSTLLTGTSWSEKAAEVLERMFAKVKNQQNRQQELEENMKKAANKPTTIYQSGSTHDDKRQQMFLDRNTETDKQLLEKKDE